MLSTLKIWSTHVPKLGFTYYATNYFSLQQGSPVRASAVNCLCGKLWNCGSWFSFQTILIALYSSPAPTQSLLHLIPLVILLSVVVDMK